MKVIYPLYNISIKLGREKTKFLGGFAYADKFFHITIKDGHTNIYFNIPIKNYPKDLKRVFKEIQKELYIK